MGELEDRITYPSSVGAVLDHKHSRNKPKPKRQVFWRGFIDSCDICRGEIADQFVDGKTTYGPWGILCLRCHKDKGCGLGMGRGQRYERQDDGRWLKVEG